MAQMKQQRLDDQNRIKELDRELKETKMSAKGGAMDKDKRSTDKKTRVSKIVTSMLCSICKVISFRQLAIYSLS